jgi:hypothetical protein
VESNNAANATGILNLLWHGVATVPQNTASFCELGAAIKYRRTESGINAPDRSNHAAKCSEFLCAGMAGWRVRDKGGGEAIGRHGVVLGGVVTAPGG